MSITVSGNTLAEVAALVGEPARANILSALMSGRALTATELTWHAGVSAQTTSGHLAKMSAAYLVVAVKQGRHRYYRLASPEIARAVEALMAVAAVGPKRHRPTGPHDEAMRVARTCYDHLAGRLGTGLANSMHDRGYVILADDRDGAAIITEQGAGFLRDALQIELDARGKRPLCRTCLDWSERRPHLAGRLGAALCRRAFELRWITHLQGSRAVAITSVGQRNFKDLFGFLS